MNFAKLFERPGYGQVLAKLDAGDEGKPELRWYAQPPTLGVCSFALCFEDTDDGWDAAERAFNGADEAAADAAGKALWSAAGHESTPEGKVLK